jgi:hypothetical protein
MAAVSAASPSLPIGSCADPAVNSSFRLSWGSTDFWTVSRSGASLEGAAGGSAGAAGLAPAASNATAGLT